MTVIFQGKQLSGRFVLPSGIIATKFPTIEKVAERIPEIGVITTKSVGIEPEEGYREPILCQDSPLNFVNAVGLRSQGMAQFLNEFSEMRLRHSRDRLFDKKFLMTSIFGKTEKEFGFLIDRLSEVADGFELNLSCPHSKPGYGANIGSHPETTYSFTREAAAKASDFEKPVFVKLTPNLENIDEIAKAAVEAGASGITAVNTVGPCEFREPATGKVVLTHKTGGRSGRWIKDIGSKAVRQIRNAVGPNIPIIGMGGISSADDVRDYCDADLYGVGSVLAGLSLEEIASFFRKLESDLANGTGNAVSSLPKRNLMEYRSVKISEIHELDHDLRVLKFQENIPFLPGQFFFLWLPGKGEKPFSPGISEPLTFAIRKRGIFTEEVFSLNVGDEMMIRGPYGRGFDPSPWDNVYILTGGTGSAAALSLATLSNSRKKNVVVFQGSISEKQVLFEKEFRKVSRFIPGIDRDSPGEVMDVMEYFLDKHKVPDNTVFFNIGPEIMMKKGIELEMNYLDKNSIFASVERETLCGVGLCGACELNGYRTCIRGTVFCASQLRNFIGEGIE